jgi:hypothetical protein
LEEWVEVGVWAWEAEEDEVWGEVKLEALMDIVSVPIALPKSLTRGGCLVFR